MVPWDFSAPDLSAAFFAFLGWMDSDFNPSSSSSSSSSWLPSVYSLVTAAWYWLLCLLAAEQSLPGPGL